MSTDKENCPAWEASTQNAITTYWLGVKGRDPIAKARQLRWKPQEVEWTILQYRPLECSRQGETQTVEEAIDYIVSQVGPILQAAGYGPIQPFSVPTPPEPGTLLWEVIETRRVFVASSTEFDALCLGRKALTEALPSGHHLTVDVEKVESGNPNLPLSWDTPVVHAEGSKALTIRDVLWAQK